MSIFSDSLWFLLCKMNSEVMKLLSQTGILVKYHIPYFSLVFYWTENWIGPKIAISALFGVMLIQRSITSWLLYLLYTWLLRPVSVPLFEAIRMLSPSQEENNLVLHNQKYVIVTLSFWKIEPYSFDQITEMRKADIVLLSNPPDTCYRIKCDNLKDMVREWL